MAGEKSNQEWPIRLLGVVREKPLGKWDSGLRVTLQVVREPDFMSFSLTFPIPLGVDEADAVKLARNYLHRSMRFAADQTSAWMLSDEEISAITADKGAT